MGTRIFYSIKSQFNFVNNDFFNDNMYRVVSFFWSFVCFYSFYLFGLLSRHIFRCQESENLDKYEANSSDVRHKEDGFQMGSSCCNDSEIDQSDEDNSVVMASSNRYEFLSGKGVCGFVEEPRTLSFTIHELFVDSNNNDAVMDTPILDAEEAEKEGAFVNGKVLEKEERKFMEEFISEVGNHESDEEKTEDSFKSLVFEEVSEQPETQKFTKEIDDIDQKEDSSNEVQSLPECDAEEESVCSNDVFLEKIDKIDSITGFVDQVSEPETPLCIDQVSEPETTDSEDEYIELQPQKESSIFVDHEQQEEKASVDEDCCVFEQKPSNFQVENDNDSMLEHQDIIEQLKMELKLARTGGLPTILEESESEEIETPKTIQELKPMKFDNQQFDYKHLLEGIQKVYKNYSDKMRKLDILNFQIMHSVGLLEMKGTVELQAMQKKSWVPGLISILPQNLRLCKGSAAIDPTKKVIADMHRDFETIYIGQLCLSWEILQWQYWKAQELQDYESQGCHRFNQVAGEFQLFQVLIHRFLENEQFQGPTRIQNYVKNRCVLRSLLQVPLLKEDGFKDKGKIGNENHEDAITSQIPASIIEQSMKVFWEFLRADKDESNMIFHSHIQSRSNLQELVDLELLTDIRTDFQKKDKKLKDILRSGNCIVKRFKKQQEYGMHQRLLIAQVELKLVWRVLNMSKLTTDKLTWCHEKLNKINFSNRQVLVESSFLLFPC